MLSVVQIDKAVYERERYFETIAFIAICIESGSVFNVPVFSRMSIVHILNEFIKRVKNHKLNLRYTVGWAQKVSLIIIAIILCTVNQLS